MKTAAVPTSLFACILIFSVFTRQVQQTPDVLDTVRDASMTYELQGRVCVTIAAGNELVSVMLPQ